ncbi:MAG: hypothetical protein ACJ8FY_24000 [Gemmataceae bacterium]
MIEVTCQTCGEKTSVQSCLAAAQQLCGQCGQLLMGPLARGSRTTRPPAFAESLPGPTEPEYGPSNTAGLWLGVVAGAAVGIGAVAAVANMGAVVPLFLRGVILAALTGVVLAPIFAISSFISMLVLPFSLEGIFGDCMWSRMATALHHRRPGKLFLPILLYVVLPVTLCGFGGSKMKDPSLLVISAGLGAAMLGAVVGGIIGSRSRKPA